MAFQADDIYTSSGSTKVQNFWTPYVSKFDTSSFYNWEQDNAPIYDLEERTYEIWEQTGYPTSSVPGLALVVSGDADTASLEANPNIFTTVSACIAAIPKVVRFPVLVEVCNFGDLGDLELHNFRIEEGGSIEIINRAFTKFYASSTVGGANYTAPNVTNNTSFALPADIISPDASSTINDISSIILESTLVSSTTDARLTESPISFSYPISSSRLCALHVSQDTSIFTPYLYADFAFARDPYERIHTEDITSKTFDISALSQYDSSRSTYRGDPTPVATQYTGIFTFNYLNSISVKNCDGPIYIRNFIADGGRTSTGGEEVGIYVENSNVVIENCGALKCLDSGFKFNNSKVILSRSAFSYRNYDISSTTDRIANTGIGFEINNSEVILSANLESTNGNYDIDASGSDVIFCASRNDKGFVLNNSVLRGGFARTTLANPDTGGSLASELNTSYGLELNNSKVDLEGLVDVYANDIGIKAHNSFVNFENLCVESHNTRGIESYNSVFTFDSKDNVLASKGSGQTVRKAVDFRENGQHISLSKNSTFDFKETTDMPSKFGGMFFSSCHGTTTWEGSTQRDTPAISVDSNSNAKFIHCVIGTRLGTESDSDPCFGEAVACEDNSQVDFYGSSGGCTAVIGAGSRDFHSLLYASNNSKVGIHGPTVLGQCGIDILAEDNSEINIEPPKSSKGALDVSGFNLEHPENHTSVELHSTRACLVTNKNSTLNMKDLGSYPYFWSATTNGQTILGSEFDYNNNNDFDSSSYTYQGSLQFYPNAFGKTVEDEFDLESNGITLNLVNFPIFTTESGQNSFLAGSYVTPDYATASSISMGGMAVRAIGGSNVNVRNVHFPTNINSSPADGLYYSVSGTDCDRFMIWNIADTSRLHAAYIAVSGGYPSDAGYHGPSALYFSATSPGAATYSPAYGAPSSTPDTGTLSVLDQFGAGSSVWVVPQYTELNSPFDQIASGILEAPTETIAYGTTDGTFNNQGLFRLYFSVDSAAKLLQNDLSGYDYGAYPHTGNFSGVVGPTYQILAQGYNMSAPVSALTPEGATSVSSLYPQLLKYSNGNLHTSGFYWCKEFVPDDQHQCVLDESASNVFANAKNASTGMSGKPKKVMIYRSRLNDRGSDSYLGDEDIAHFRSATIFDLEREV
jgi:hypothetical protein